jgi:Rha family phage regulatory protein
MNKEITVSNEEYTISTLDIADMMGMQHKNLLRKLEGRTEKGKHIKGYIEILDEHQMEPVEFFIKNSYVDDKGETRPCYEVTKMGCEFLANKFTGEKGVLFTAKYIKRFHEMEDALKQVQQEQNNTLGKIPENLLLERETDWYSTRKSKINYVRDKFDMTKREYMHRILEGINEYYNFDSARKKFIALNDRLPWNNSEVISYFPQLRKIADEILYNDMKCCLDEE